MATDDISKKLFVLMLSWLTFLVLGCFVVSFNIIHFVYLFVLYIYIYKIGRIIIMIK